MSPSRITTHYVNIEMPVVMAEDLPDSVKVTYMYLKALAWNKKVIVFSNLEFEALFGIPQSTLYRHLSLLSKSAVLRFELPDNRTKGSVYVEFLVNMSKPISRGRQAAAETGAASWEEA